MKKGLQDKTTCRRDEKARRQDNKPRRPFPGRKKLLPAAAAVLITAAVLTGAGSGLPDTVGDGYLMRGDYGTADLETELRVTGDGISRQVTVTVPAKTYTPAEEEAFLDKAEARLGEAVFDGMSPSHADRDLDLAAAAGDLPVAITWYSYTPELVGDDGRLGSAIPEEGAEAVMAAVITCQEAVRQVTLTFRVYPGRKTEEEAFREALDAAIRSGTTEDRVLLPAEIGGRAVVWHTPRAGKYLGALFLGFLVGVLVRYALREKERQAEEAYREALLKDYPPLISKLVLLLGAGLSLSMTCRRMATDYQEERQRSGRIRPGFELVVQACDDMDKGLSEAEAYRRLGESSGLGLYRTFSVLLVQNLRRGSTEMLAVFRREAETAFEERKKAARLKGEKASSRLLLPMMLMLMIIFAIVMIPAWLAF